MPSSWDGVFTVEVQGLGIWVWSLGLMICFRLYKAYRKGPSYKDHIP